MVEQKAPVLLLRVEEAGRLLGYSRASMYTMIRRRELPVVRFGRRGIRIHLDHLKALLEARVQLAADGPGREDSSGG